MPRSQVKESSPRSSTSHNCQGYRTGGTIHLVVNNQIGFTTGPDEARSSRYCTDVAKIVDAPIFHVNGNDPLATIAAIEAAFDYRQTFGSDVVIDMYCWRKHGHNESDEPAFTQPTLYKKISSMQPIGRALGDRLVASGEFTERKSAPLRPITMHASKLPLKSRKRRKASRATYSPSRPRNSSRLTTSRASTRACLKAQIEAHRRALGAIP